MKSKKIIFITIIACILLYLIPNIIYTYHFIGNLSLDPAVWGQYGDFIGGSINPILTILSIIALVYLTYTVSHTDDKRILNQFRYEAYTDLKSKLKPSLNDEAVRFTNKLKVEYEKMKDALVAFQQYSSFLFEDNDFNEKLRQLIDEVKLVCLDLDNFGENRVIHARGEITFVTTSRTKEDEDFFEKRELAIIKMKAELLVLMQKKILDK